MNASLRDLRRRADELTPPSFDLQHIMERGDATLRRRRAGLAAGAAGLVVAVIATGAVLTGSDQPSNEPAQTPSPSATEAPTEPSIRQLAYADVEAEQAPRLVIRSVNYGDQILRLSMNVMHIDVTDDGLALVAEDGSIYFADGSTVERIGELTIDVSWADGGVISGSTGPLLAWLSPDEPATTVVVYDTHERKVVTRVPVPGCDDARGCSLKAVIGERIYWSENEVDADPTSRTLLKALEVPDGTVAESNMGELWDDLRALPRAVIKGDSFADGEVVNERVNQEAVHFVADGSSLVLRRFVEAGPGDADDTYAYGGFDTTGRRLNLQLPDGYAPAATTYALFQWLDDDTFAVMAGATHNEFGWNGFPGYGDILVCNIARERCTLAARGPTDDDFRIVPHLDVPN